MAHEPELIGDWVNERVFGSGGFGIVTLWGNCRTNEKIAIKKCRGDHGNTLTAKNKERWTTEVEMMQRINNKNIVSFYKLPPDFETELQKYNPTKLPMLSMEYCTKGDLRRVITQSGNSCGLPESDIRYILWDLMNAVSYLHTLKITHRDLKPENVVLQVCDRPNGIIYKLIDLGYAKEIDASSIAGSFVGTMQYLAPEFFHSKTYSCSVDYWSLGLVTFEIVCGYRPFLPNMSPAQWLMHVPKKQVDHISIYQNDNEEIIYSSEIFPENHVSLCFKREIEKWLQLALEFHPKKRGYRNYDPKKSENELIIFTALQKLLEKKIITLFSTFTYNYFSYEIDDFTLISTLQGWIERDTKILKNEQFLLSLKAELIKPDDLVKDYFDETYMNRVMIYVFQKSIMLKEIVTPVIPPLVKLMLENSKRCLPYYFQKKSYAHALYFVFKENTLYNTLLDACKLKIKYLIKILEDFGDKCKDISISIKMLIAQKNFSKEILDFDVKQYLKNYSQDASHWTESFCTVANKIDNLSEISTRLLYRYNSAYRRISEINIESDKQYSKYSEHELNVQLDKAVAVFNKIKSRSKDKRTKPESCTDMIKVLYNVLKERDRLLLDTFFKNYRQKIVELDFELEKMSSPLEIALQQIDKLKTNLLSDQIARQTKIWDFTIKQKSKTKTAETVTDVNKTCAPKPDFVIGNQSISNIDYGEPISLEKPLLFILGDTQNIELNSTDKSSNFYISDKQSDNQQIYIKNKEEYTEPQGLINEFNDKQEVDDTDKHNNHDFKNLSLNESQQIKLTLPIFAIGAPLSEVINDNKTLRYELQEKTNESFMKCKSILNETLDFDFLNIVND